MDDYDRRDADRIRMQPDRAAFREAVQNENVSSWGTAPMVPERGGPTDRDHDGVPDRVDPSVGTIHSGPTTSAATGTTVGRSVATEAPVDRPRFSIGATFLGWAVASFFSLVFLALITGFLGGAAANDVVNGDGVSASDATSLGMTGIVTTLIALFVAYLIGGYAAGRIALWHGAAHGMATVAWAVLFGILGFVAAAALGADLARYLGFSFDLGAFTNEAILGTVLGILASILGGALGGRLGERYHDRFHGRAAARRRTVRGRPL